MKDNTDCNQEAHLLSSPDLQARSSNPATGQQHDGRLWQPELEPFPKGASAARLRPVLPSGSSIVATNVAEIELVAQFENCAVARLALAQFQTALPDYLCIREVLRLRGRVI